MSASDIARLFAQTTGAGDTSCRRDHLVLMDFLREPLTALRGWLLYAERMYPLTVLDAAIILDGNPA